MTTANPSETSLIYDWNRAGGDDLRPLRGRVELDDETLRDGLQSPSVRSPSIEDKLRILHWMAVLGIESADLGLPGAGPHVVRDVERLAREIVEQKLPVEPNCAARTVIADDTDEKANQRRDFYIGTSDKAAMAEWARGAGMDFSRATYKDLAVQTFMAIPYVAGSYQTVANYLDGLAENGIAGVCFIFPDYDNDLELIIDKVLPLMKHRSALAPQLMIA